LQIILMNACCLFKISKNEVKRTFDSYGEKRIFSRLRSDQQ
jgi:hypothetical protein